MKIKTKHTIEDAGDYSDVVEMYINRLRRDSTLDNTQKENFLTTFKKELDKLATEVFNKGIEFERGQ